MADPKSGLVQKEVPHQNWGKGAAPSNPRSSRRCFTKTAGTFGSPALPVLPIVPPYQQDGLEMKPLNHHVMVTMCLASSGPSECGVRLEEDGKERAELPCCRDGSNHLSGDYTDGKSRWPTPPISVLMADGMFSGCWG